jgi:peroxiredoxin
VNEVVTNLAFFSSSIDRKQPALRTSFSSSLKLEVTNYRYKDGVSEPAKVVLAALDAAIADSDAREAPNPDNLTTLREKIDTLTQTPGGARFLVERERSYAHVLYVSSPNAARSEAHLKKLLEHPDKPMATMARDELNVLDARKAPFELKVTALDGKEIDLAQLRGKVVGMYVWSSTHKQSTDRIEDLKRIYAEYRKRGFEIVTVSYDKAEDREKLTKYVKDNRIAWPVYYDGKGAKNDFAPKINATGTPRLYIFDQKGILQMTLAGSPVARVTADFPQNQLEGKVKQLLGIK